MDAFTSRGYELPSVYRQDNRHRVPTNSCCFSLLPVVRIRKGEKERGEVQERGVGGGQRGEEDRTISAGKRRALVHSLFTVESCVAVGTLAHVAAAIVLFPALAAMETGRVCTGQQSVLTVGALETLGACAHVAGVKILEGKDGTRGQRLFGRVGRKVPQYSCLEPPLPTHRAYASVPTGVAVTLLHLQLTVDSRESGQARARVAALPGVHAGGAIHTGVMMRAEVEIWETGEATRIENEEAVL